MQLVLISGLSGSGKSIALNVLEDSGYYCVDNLPAPLLSDLVGHLRLEGQDLAAVAVDMRGGSSIAALPPQLRKLEAEGVTLRFVFLDARDDVLIQRFSETRRRHPLATDDVTLGEAIAREREALEMLASLGHHIDTSDIGANTLRQWIKDFIQIDRLRLTLLFQSFGFKYGVPLDSDLVFDVHEGVVVDPTEERLRDEFGQTRVLHLPMQSIVRIEEVERKGTSAIRDAATGEKVVTPFPLPAKPR